MTQAANPGPNRLSYEREPNRLGFQERQGGPSVQPTTRSARTVQALIVAVAILAITLMVVLIYLYLGPEAALLAALIGGILALRMTGVGRDRR